MESLYKRHTPFSMMLHKTTIEGDIIKITPRGDLISYVYLTRVDAKSGVTLSWDWQTINEFKWYIGQNLIDTQNINFIRYVAPTILSRNLSKLNLNTAESTFLPLAFSFCTDLPFPIVALNFDPMYIKLSFGSTYDPSLYCYEVHMMYMYLDKPERDFFASGSPIDIQISQTNLLTNLNDVSLRGPIKFIATPPVKIPSTFTYSYTINGKTTEQYDYTGAELMFHNTNYTQRSINSPDVFPPNKLNAQTTFIESPYSVGNYTVTASSNNSNAWKARDTSWRTEQPIITTTRYIASASSNTLNAWKSSASIGNYWKSDSIYGERFTYSVDASSNASYAYQAVDLASADTSWISDPSSYGNASTISVTVSASSNNGYAPYTSDGKDDTSWTSDPQSFYSDDVGSYMVANVSSGTNAMNAFTHGANEWVSANTYGVFINSGTYQYTPAEAYLMTDISISTPFKNVSTQYGQFESYGPSYTYTASTTTDAIYNQTSKLLTWQSNVTKSIYGYGTSNGVYSTTSSSNIINSYLIANSSGKSWISDSTYQTNFISGFTLSSTSNSLYIYKAHDYNTDTAWVSNDLYGYTSISGICNVYGTSNTNSSFAWFAFDSNASTTWYSGNIYGNVLLTGTFSITASSNVGNAYLTSNIGNAWISTNNFGIYSLAPGTYTASNSASIFSGDASNVFGNSSIWTSNIGYGSLLPYGVYGNVTNTGNAFINTTPFSWIGTTNVSTATATANIVYDYFSYYGSNAYMTASANATNAYCAFTTTTPSFKFGSTNYRTVTDSFTPKYYSSESPTPNEYTDYDQGGSLSYTSPTSSKFSYMLMGTYTTNYRSLISPPTYWPSESSYVTITTANVYNEFYGTCPTNQTPYISIQFPSPIPSDYTITSFPTSTDRQTFTYYTSPPPTSAPYLSNTDMFITTNDFSGWTANSVASPVATFPLSQFACYSGTYTIGVSPSDLVVSNIESVFGYQSATRPMTVSTYSVASSTQPDFYISLTHSNNIYDSPLPSLPDGFSQMNIINNQLRLYFTPSSNTSYRAQITTPYIASQSTASTQNSGTIIGDFTITLYNVDVNGTKLLTYQNVVSLLSTSGTSLSNKVTMADLPIGETDTDTQNAGINFDGGFVKIFSITSSLINQVTPDTSEAPFSSIINQRVIDFKLPYTIKYPESPRINNYYFGSGLSFGIFPAGTTMTYTYAKYGYVSGSGGVTTPYTITDIINNRQIPNLTYTDLLIYYNIPYINDQYNVFTLVGLDLGTSQVRYTITPDMYPDIASCFQIYDSYYFPTINECYFDNSIGRLYLMSKTRDPTNGTSVSSYIYPQLKNKTSLVGIPYLNISWITTTSTIFAQPGSKQWVLYAPIDYSSSRVYDYKGIQLFDRYNYAIRQIDFTTFFASYPLISEISGSLTGQGDSSTNNATVSFTVQRNVNSNIYNITNPNTIAYTIQYTNLKYDVQSGTTSIYINQAPVGKFSGGQTQFNRSISFTDLTFPSSTIIKSITLPVSTGLISPNKIDYVIGYMSKSVTTSSVPSVAGTYNMTIRITIDAGYVYYYNNKVIQFYFATATAPTTTTYSFTIATGTQQYDINIGTITLRDSTTYELRFKSQTVVISDPIVTNIDFIINGSNNYVSSSQQLANYSFTTKTFGKYGETQNVPIATSIINNSQLPYDPFSTRFPNTGSVTRKLESSVYSLLYIGSIYNITQSPTSATLVYSANSIINGVLSPYTNPTSSFANGISITMTSVSASSKPTNDITLTVTSSPTGSRPLNNRYSLNRQITINANDIGSPIYGGSIIPINQITIGTGSQTVISSSSSGIDLVSGGICLDANKPTFIVTFGTTPRNISRISFRIYPTSNITFIGVTSSPTAVNETIVSNTITTSGTNTAVYFTDCLPQNVYKIKIQVNKISLNPTVQLDNFNIYTDTGVYTVTNTIVNGSNGGDYTIPPDGSIISTGTMYGHYVQYSTSVANTISKVIFNDTNIQDVYIAGNQNGSGLFTQIIKLTSITNGVQNYISGQTVDYNSFRFIVSKTTSSSTDKDVTIGNIQIYFNDGRVSFFNATSNSAMTTTDGLDVSVYRPGYENFGDTPRLYIKRCMMNTGNPFRDIIAYSEIPSYMYMFYGNIMSNVAMSNVVIICTNGPSQDRERFTNVWIGTSAVTGSYTPSNRLTSTGIYSNIFYQSPPYNLTANTSIGLRITALNGLSPDFKFFIADGGTGTSYTNIQAIDGTYIPGGLSSNIGGGASITFTLPFPVQVYSYIIKTTATRWSLYGGSVTTPIDIQTTNASGRINISGTPSAYSTYRFVITESSTLYATIDYLVLLDFYGRPVVKSFGTYTSNNSIANCPVGVYTSTNPNVIGKLDTTSTSSSVTITFPQSITITSILVIVSGGGTFSFGSTSYITSNVLYNVDTTGTTFTVTASAGCYITFFSLYNMFGEVTPRLSTSTQLVLYDTKYGGKYIGTTTTSGFAGEWIQINAPTKNPIFSYTVSPRPAGFTLLESMDGVTYSQTPIHSISNVYTIDDGKAYTFANLISNNSYRLVITETIGNTSAIINSVNLYSRSNVLKVQTLSVPVFGTTYTPLLNPGDGINGTFDVSTRNFNSNALSTVSGAVSFTTTFSNVNVLTKMTFENSLSIGLFVKEGDGRKNYYSGIISSAATGGVDATGYIYMHMSPVTIICRSTVGTDITVAGVTKKVTNSDDGGRFDFSGTQYTFYELRIQSTSSLGVSIMVGSLEYADTTNWFFATQNLVRSILDYPTSLSFNNGIPSVIGGTPKLFSNIILSPPTKPYTSIQVTLSGNGPHRLNMNNIKFYDAYGVINIPGSFGGNCMTTTGEFIQYTLPSDTRITDYSVTTNATAWGLYASTSASPTTYQVLDVRQWDGVSTLFSVTPTNAYKYYKLIITETYGSERVYVSNLRLFNNCNEVTPYMYNNTTGPITKYINTALVGNYTIYSSYGQIQQFDSFNTGVPAIVANDEIIKNASISSTLVLDVSPQKLLYGAWVEIGFPKSISANIYSLQVINVASTANIFTIVGSNERVNWYVSNVNSGFVPVINNTYLFTAVNTPFRYYRIICSNTYDTSTTTFNIGKFSILDANCNQLNSQVTPTNLNIRDVNLFGGTGQESVTINVASSFYLGGILSNANISNISIRYGTTNTLHGTFINPEIYGDYSLFRIPQIPTLEKTFTIITNRVKYGTMNVISATDIQLLDSKLRYVLPTFTNNNFTAPPQLLPAVSFFSEYTCSNVFPFDDDPTTCWSNNSYNSVTTQPLFGKANVDITFPYTTTVVGYYLLNPYIGSWEIRGDSETIVDVNSGSNIYYPLSPPITTKRFRLSVTQSISGSNIVALNGLTLYDSKGRINPTMTGPSMNIVSNYRLFGGSNVQSANIIAHLPYNANANSITICANPFPASFTVYANTGTSPSLIKLLSVSNMYSPVTTMSFPLDAYTPVSNLVLSVYTNATIQTIQYYDYNGTALLPLFTTDSSTYDSVTKYSSESVGPYKITASSNASNAWLAFNGDLTNFYQNLDGTNPSTSLLANGFVMYYNNNVIFNCTDFRNITQATRDVTGTGTRKWTSNTLLSSLLLSETTGITRVDDYSFTIPDVQNFNIKFQNGTSIVTPYQTNGVNGEWLQIQLPAAATKVQLFTVTSPNPGATFKVFGSSNAVTWIDMTPGIQVQSNTPTRVTSTQLSFYYIRLVCTGPKLQVSDFGLYNEYGRINSYINTIS